MYGRETIQKLIACGNSWQIYCDGGNFLGCNKSTKGFRFAKKSGDFFWWANSEVGIFLGIKYELLLYPGCL